MAGRRLGRLLLEPRCREACKESIIFVHWCEITVVVVVVGCATHHVAYRPSVCVKLDTVQAVCYVVGEVVLVLYLLVQFLLVFFRIRQHSLISEMYWRLCQHQHQTKTDKYSSSPNLNHHSPQQLHLERLAVVSEPLDVVLVIIRRNPILVQVFF